MPGVKSFAQIFSIALGVGRYQQTMRALARAMGVGRPRRNVMPHEGAREIARRRRQIEAGMLCPIYQPERKG
jgi:hypothetical protein